MNTNKELFVQKIRAIHAMCVSSKKGFTLQEGPFLQRAQRISNLWLMGLDNDDFSQHLKTTGIINQYTGKVIPLLQPCYFLFHLLLLKMLTYFTVVIMFERSSKSGKQN